MSSIETIDFDIAKAPRSQPMNTRINIAVSSLADARVRQQRSWSG
jgi:hypothetical protein